MAISDDQKVSNAQRVAHAGHQASHAGRQAGRQAGHAKLVNRRAGH